MIKKLFGETEDEQLAFLEKKLLITLVIAVVSLIAELIFSGAGGIIVVAFVMWGWYGVRPFLGVASFGAIFSKNPIVWVLILFALLTVGYFAGIVAFVVALARYIQLKTRIISAKQRINQHSSQQSTQPANEEDRLN